MSGDEDGDYDFPLIHQRKNEIDGDVRKTNRDKKVNKREYKDRSSPFSSFLFRFNSVSLVAGHGLFVRYLRFITIYCFLELWLSYCLPTVLHGVFIR